MDSKHIIAFHREYVDVTGSITAALMLSQAVYWTQKTDDGWFYKNQADWEDETGLTRTEYTTARKRLRSLPCWQEDRHGPRGTIRFRVDMAQLQSSGFLQAESISLQDSCNSVYRNPVNQSSGILQTPYTESTTESTTESKGTRETPQPTKSEPQTPPPKKPPYKNSEHRRAQMNVAEASKIGMDKRQLLEWTNWVLEQAGQTAIANAAEDDSRIGQAQLTAINLWQLGNDTMDGLKDIRSWLDKSYQSAPYYPKNLENAASAIVAGTPPPGADKPNQPPVSQTEATFSMEDLTQ